MSTAQRTPLYACHVAAGAKIVDFGGWDMPLHYGSQVDEHHRVRSDCGVFDVSHMTVIDIGGVDALGFLQRLLANDIARLDRPGKALYTAMLNERGGVIDDLIVYAMPDSGYRLVTNCATRDKDLVWIEEVARGFEVSVQERPDLAILAVQGPRAIAVVQSLCTADDAVSVGALAPFTATQLGDWFVTRTGYTGEDGVEILLPGSLAETLWHSLRKAGASPAGLAARDTLRLEAGMNLYGNEMHEAISPLEANMGWTVAWEPEGRDFIGRAALESQRSEGISSKLVGLVMTGRGVLRSHMPVRVSWSDRIGEITSGTFSPTLGHSIALARVPVGTGDQVEVEMRGKWVPVRLVKAGFVRDGQKIFD